MFLVEVSFTVEPLTLYDTQDTELTLNVPVRLLIVTVFVSALYPNEILVVFAVIFGVGVGVFVFVGVGVFVGAGLAFWLIFSLHVLLLLSLNTISVLRADPVLALIVSLYDVPERLSTVIQLQLHAPGMLGVRLAPLSVTLIT